MGGWLQLYKMREDKYMLDLQRIEGSYFLFLDICTSLLSELHVPWSHCSASFFFTPLSFPVLFVCVECTQDLSFCPELCSFSKTLGVRENVIGTLLCIVARVWSLQRLRSKQEVKSLLDLNPKIAGCRVQFFRRRHRIFFLICQRSNRFARLQFP